MQLELRNVKGTKDYLPEEQRVRAFIRNTLERVFLTYGCKPLETPMLQYYDLLASKYGGGEEILKEVYKLQDQGQRDLAMRYDLTIPLAKVIGMNPEMRLPFKRYEIGKVFRDGPIKLGRFREFTQCDVDVVGVPSVIAEAELMTMAADAFAQLGLSVVISYNNRKLLTGVLAALAVEEEQWEGAMLSLDKWEKIGAEGVRKDMEERGIGRAAIDSLLAFIMDEQEKTVAYLASRFADSALVQEGAAELAQLAEYLIAAGIADQTQFTPFLARGLSIYTGTVYEIFLRDGSITSSIGSGGRYDRIIGQFLQNGKEYPAVGISFGLDVIATALLQKDREVEEEELRVFFIPIGTEKESMAMVQFLRKAGIRTELELTGKRMKKALDYANKEGFPFVLIYGETEAQNGVVVLRSMREGVEQKVAQDELVSVLQKLL
ncbi:histidine--tRNA ligase [Brevibacillus fluminis]|uniref:Histidine--tRNA ligase n=1 Tax=Brevibacillus fluminis TaxID=511487 RepID=A0A3M8DZ66_9BACL|nr:histidine--tRNA ligase [Brevibacillus fluminis]RNB92267.1 histidine--tRNA ligase [Brevibacillus fluminis]